MQFFDRGNEIAEAHRRKPRITHHLKLMLQKHMSQRQQRRLLSWVQDRKQAAERIRSLSKGNLELIGNDYRGDHRRHLLTDIRCNHVFCASLRELVLESVDQACPFCHPVHPLSRYISVPAAQEFVLERSDGKILFAASNHLGRRDDDYAFTCTIHRLRFEASFKCFIDKTEAGKDFCPVCSSRS